MFFVFVLFFVLFFSPLVLSHGSHGNVAFEEPFFVIAFGGLGVGLYASIAESKSKDLRFFELLGSFFLGYYLFSFLFTLLLKVSLS